MFSDEKGANFIAESRYEARLSFLSWCELVDSEQNILNHPVQRG